MATAKVKIFGEITGLGSDTKLSLQFTGRTPTECGKNIVACGQTTTKVDLTSVVSGEILGVIIKSVTSIIYCSPLSSANVTACLYMDSGEGVALTFKSSVSAWPWIVGGGSDAVAEYIYWAGTT